jgi:TolA-binding protein
VTDRDRREEAPEGQPREAHPAGQPQGPTEDHPEDILHRARVGSPLSARERAIRAQHLRSCDVCRLLEQARLELLDEAARPGGESITALVAATMASFQVAPAPVPAATPAETGRRRRAPLPARLALPAAAVVCLVAGAALAARWIVEARTAPRARAEASPSAAPSGRVALHYPTASPAARPVDPAPGVPDAWEAPAPPEVSAASSAAASGGPAALFARATEARRAGRIDEARRTYERLWRDFPGTAEAQTGRVAYARWLLDRHQPQPAAVAFGDYLRTNPHGTLTAEAAVGLAEAFEALDDWREARRAWEQVLVEPGARAFARHARARLRALEARTPDRAGGERER